MKKFMASLALALSVLLLPACDREREPAQAGSEAASTATAPAATTVPMPKSFAELVAGRDFELIDPAPTAAASPIEVAEAFSYACSHCAHFEPFIETWRATLPEDVRFEAVPMPFNEVWTEFARAYYAAGDLGITGRTHAALFRALHEQAITIDSVEALVRWFAATGSVDAARFREAMTSPGTDTRIESASSRARRWGVDSTPTLVIGNRYKVYGFAEGEGGYARTIAVADLVISHLRDAGDS